MKSETPKSYVVQVGNKFLQSSNPNDLTGKLNNAKTFNYTQCVRMCNHVLKYMQTTKKDFSTDIKMVIKK